MSDTQYAAFISYNHADARWAAWLQTRIERYRVPSHLVGRPGPNGAVSKKIGRCFRDRSELPAGSSLSEALQLALRQSRALIVVCSPRSAHSHWVNEEIRYFKSLGRNAAIYALIVDGEPNAEDPAQRCLPAALLTDEDGNAIGEPLAADVRANKDGRHEGFLKLAAGLLGIGFDELFRREQRRRARVLGGLVAAAAVIATVTTVLAVAAIQARNEATRARDEATQRRQQADDLIGFMLGDLKNQIEKLGRLDVLDATVAKTMTYLGEADLPSSDRDGLARRSEALVAISELRYARNEVNDAIAIARQAVDAARQVHQLDSSAASGLLLAEALYALAEPLLEAGAYQEAVPLSREGHALAQTLVQAESNRDDYAYLMARLDDQLGYFHLFSGHGNRDAAVEHWDDCIARMHRHAAFADADSKLTRFLLRCYQNRSIADFDEHNNPAAYAELLAVIENALERYPRDQALRYFALGATEMVTLGFARKGDIEDARKASALYVANAQRLVNFDAENLAWRTMLARGYSSDAFVLRLSGDADQAWLRLEQAREILTDLLQVDAASELLRGGWIALHRQRASLTLARRGSRADALAELDQGARHIDTQLAGNALLVGAAWLRLQQWLYARGHDEVLAASARAESLANIERLRDSSSAQFITDLEARAAYADGRIADGERAYAMLRNESYLYISHLEEFRNFACSGPAAPAECASAQARR
jgi:eukaryotic-like serine/threonine-protein kinase